MAKKVLAVVFGIMLAPAFITAAETDLYGSFGRQIAGNPCAIRVYNTDFQFPEAGGRIVMYGPEMYFIRTGNPGCANTGTVFPTVVSSNNGYNPLQTWNNSQSYVNPAYATGYATPTTQSYNFANYAYTTAAGTQPLSSIQQPAQNPTTCR